MGILEEFDEQQMDPILRVGADKRLAVMITVYRDDTWVNHTSRFVALRGGEILLQPPVSEARDDEGFPPGQNVFMTFKLGVHKYACCVTVLRWGHFPTEDSPRSAVLATCRPTVTHRVQRRNSERHGLPDGHLAPAEFWLGDKDSEPDGLTPERPVWAGRVVDFSIRGLKLLADRNSSEVFEFGDRVGVRFSFGPEKPVYADAVYRHFSPDPRDEQQILVGLQFLGTGDTPHGRETFERIRMKIEELQGKAVVPG